MPKILFTDLDGTLLRSDKTVSEQNKQAIERMLQAGHLLVIATGRSVPSSLPIIEKLGLAGPVRCLVAYNGAVVYDCEAGRVLLERTVAIPDVEYLFSEAKRYGLYIQTYNEEHVLAERDCEELQYYMSRTGTTCELSEDVCHGLTKAPNKVLLVSLEDKERLLRFERDHREWARGRSTSVFSCPEYLEYGPLATDKGTGICFVRDYLKIEPENTYAVGDEQNDIPMIRAAGVGIAMRNAVEEAKAAADYVTERDNDHDAIAEIIEKFILD